MKIILIVPDFYPKESGFSIAFQNLCFALVQYNTVEKIIVLSPYNSGKILHKDIEVKKIKHPLRVNRFFSFGKIFGLIYSQLFSQRMISSIKSLIKQENVDLVFVESLYLGWLSYLLYKKLTIPVVTRVHGCLPEHAILGNVKMKKVFTNLALKTDCIAVTTYHYIEYLQSYFKVSHSNNKKFFVIPNTEERTSLKTREASKKITFLQLGRMNEQGYYQKGFQDVAHSLFYLERILNDVDIKRIKYISIGNGQEKKRHLKSLNKLRKIEYQHIETLPNTEVQNQISNADVILIPSRYEGMSMFVTECLAKGKSFIFTEKNGLRDMLLDNYNGIAVRPFDYLGIAKAIIRYVKNIDIVTQFSKNSIHLFEKEFSYSSVSKKFEVLKTEVKQ